MRQTILVSDTQQLRSPRFRSDFRSLVISRRDHVLDVQRDLEVSCRETMPYRLGQALREI